jgi:hypothetical protein
MESYDERRRRDEERRQARHEDRGRDRDSWWRGERSEQHDDRPRRAERGWLDYDRDPYGGPDDRQGREQQQRYSQGDERSRFSPDWSREGTQPRYSDEPYYSRNRERDADEYVRSNRSRSGGWQNDDRSQWEQRSRESIPREQRELAERSQRGDYYDPDWPYDRGERGRDVERARGAQRAGGREDEGSHYRGWYSRSGGPFSYAGGQGYALSESLIMHGPYTGRGPKGYKRSDQQIVEEACQRLERDGEIDASEIEVSAEDGIIRLRGTVHDRRTKRRAEECVESIYGARDIMNELRVSHEGREQWQGGQASQHQGGRNTQASQGSQQGSQSSQGTQASQGTQTPGMRPGAGSSTAEQTGDDKRTPRH